MLSRRTNLELWTCVQNRVLPYNPIRAWAGLSVWKPPSTVAECRGGGLENLA
jgi:hypothetical protein